jgi:uncharacterized protein (DUF2249 family)
VPELELDVCCLPRPDQHPAIFRTYDALCVGESFLLVTSHDAQQLHDDFNADHCGGYRWEYLDQGPETWRIRITKLATTPLPRILCNATGVVHDSHPGATGVMWKLHMRQRDLDSNIIQLPPSACIATHVGPEVDVLLLVLDGTGQITTELNTLDLHSGALVWLPQRSQRQVAAGPQGLSYLTVHPRRQALLLTSVPPAEP